MGVFEELKLLLQEFAESMIFRWQVQMAPEFIKRIFAIFSDFGSLLMVRSNKDAKKSLLYEELRHDNFQGSLYVCVRLMHQIEKKTRKKNCFFFQS